MKIKPLPPQCLSIFCCHCIYQYFAFHGSTFHGVFLDERPKFFVFSSFPDIFLLLERNELSISHVLVHFPLFVYVVYLKSTFMLAGRNYFRSFIKQAIVVFSFLQTQFGFSFASFRSSRVRNRLFCY